MSTQSNQEVNDKERKNISKKIDDFRLWTHSQNLKNEDIISKAVHNQTTIKQYSSELNEEENNQNRKKIKKGKTIMKNKVLYNSNANLSENVQKILSDVSKTIKKIQYPMLADPTGCLARDFDVMIEAKQKDEALFRLVRELKYKTNYEFLDETTFIVK